MSIPSEEVRAINWTLRFLYDLLDKTKTRGVPPHVRARARQLSKHFPGPMRLRMMLNKKTLAFAPDEKPYEDHQKRA